MQHCHLVGRLPHKFHVMLDDQNGVIVRHVLQELGGAKLEFTKVREGPQ